MSEKIRVLMVDDEEQFRATTKKILSRRGFETLQAGSGEEALRMLQEKPDVVILDVNMPGMDGHAVLREIRKKYPNLPVIMLTGYGAMPSAKEALAEGAFDYLTKPCDIDLLALKIGDAYRFAKEGGPPAGKTVEDVMIPISDYTTIDQDETVKSAVEKLHESFACKVSTSRIMETGHRSILVFDASGDMKGILSIVDLLEGIMPAYLHFPKPSMADSIQYSPMFWKGTFQREVRQLAARRVSEVMGPPPITIDAKANLMEASFKMISGGARRMAVLRSGKVVGVIREQDLFFEMEKLLRSS